MKPDRRYTSEIQAAWRAEFENPAFKKKTIWTLIVLGVVMVVFARFVAWVESRSGVELKDPVLQMFDPINLTWLTFLMIYVGLATALLYLVRLPKACLAALQAYTVMILIRMSAMWALPLDPPGSMITLTDPLVELFGSGQSLTRDLFFSGHTATMFLLFLVCPHPFLKRLFLGLTVIVGACVLGQHVHYTIDVLAAPFFAYGSHRIVCLWHVQRSC